MFAALALLASLVTLPTGLFPPARVALAIFGLALILWVGSRLDASWVAFAAAIMLVLFGAADQGDLMTMLGHDVIWLMIGAFVIGGAMETSGLAARLADGVARRARTTAGLFWRTTAVIVPLTFLVPSTSGRAMVMLPAMALFPVGAAGRRRRRAYAILIPVVILCATTAAFTGAGSHLLVEDLLNQRLGDRFGYARWAMWGLPYAVASSVLACAVVLRMFLNDKERQAPIEAPDAGPSKRWTWREGRVVVITVAILGLWFTTPLHGFEIATVAIVGAIALTSPGLGVISFKAGIKAVNWSLVVFVGSAMVLGQALIDTQAATWLVESALGGFRLGQGVWAEWIALFAVASISLASHLVITSHVARAAALVPPLLVMAQTAGLEPMAVLFIATAGMNYCLTFPVCSKALLLFQEVEGSSFTPRDLMRLSAVLAPLNMLLIVLVYSLWWRWTGLGL